MDLGLYNLKYPARRLLTGLLPRFANTDPNHISWAMLPVGAGVAACVWFGAHGRPWLYLLAIALLFLRMFLGTLDGLVATQFGRSSKSGEIVNRLAPELCDAAYLLALALARPEWTLPGALALAAAWLTTFAGLVGATAGLPTQSVGPAGQTDRLAAVQVALLLAWLADPRGWHFDPLGLFLWWVALGGTLTVVLRLVRHLRGARAEARHA
jgi:CDP-diacylglycerol--glycerol-3-phosphate 3-phosphatidyltransferase